MLSYFLKNSELGELSTFISPALFSVFPIKDLMMLAAQVAKNAKGKKPPFQTSFPMSANTPRERGEAYLKVYFQQIFFSDLWTLDFRSQSWSLETENQNFVLKWSPRQIVYVPQSSFVKCIRKLYLAFYRNDDSMFSETLGLLELLPLKAAMHAHFGEGDQTSVSFSLKQFQKSFERIFVECKNQNLTLGTDFVALGAMILCLYESLETLGESYDVRAAFEGAIVGFKDE